MAIYDEEYAKQKAITRNMGRPKAKIRTIKEMQGGRSPASDMGGSLTPNPGIGPTLAQAPVLTGSDISGGRRSNLPSNRMDTQPGRGQAAIAGVPSSMTKPQNTGFTSFQPNDVQGATVLGVSSAGIGDNVDLERARIAPIVTPTAELQYAREEAAETSRQRQKAINKLRSTQGDPETQAFWAQKIEEEMGADAPMDVLSAAADRREIIQNRQADIQAEQQRVAAEKARKALEAQQKAQQKALQKADEEETARITKQGEITYESEFNKAQSPEAQMEWAKAAIQDPNFSNMSTSFQKRMRSLAGVGATPLGKERAKVIADEQKKEAQRSALDKMSQAKAARSRLDEDTYRSVMDTFTREELDTLSPSQQIEIGSYNYERSTPIQAELRKQSQKRLDSVMDIRTKIEKQNEQYFNNAFRTVAGVKMFDVSDTWFNKLAKNVLSRDIRSEAKMLKMKPAELTSMLYDSIYDYVRSSPDIPEDEEDDILDKLSAAIGRTATRGQRESIVDNINKQISDSSDMSPEARSALEARKAMAMGQPVASAKKKVTSDAPILDVEPPKDNILDVEPPKDNILDVEPPKDTKTPKTKNVPKIIDVETEEPPKDWKGSIVFYAPNAEGISSWKGKKLDRAEATKLPKVPFDAGNAERWLELTTPETMDKLKGIHERYAKKLATGSFIPGKEESAPTRIDVDLESLQSDVAKALGYNSYGSLRDNAITDPESWSAYQAVKSQVLAVAKANRMEMVLNKYSTPSGMTTQNIYNQLTVDERQALEDRAKRSKAYTNMEKNQEAALMRDIVEKAAAKNVDGWSGIPYIGPMYDAVKRAAIGGGKTAENMLQRWTKDGDELKDALIHNAQTVSTFNDIEALTDKKLDRDLITRGFMNVTRSLIQHAPFAIAGGPKGMALSAGYTAYDDTVGEALLNGYSLEEAHRFGVPQAVLEAGITLAAGKLFGAGAEGIISTGLTSSMKDQVFKSPIRAIVKSLVGEVLEENAVTITQDLHKRMEKFGKVPETLDEYVNMLKEVTVPAIIGGGIGGLRTAWSSVEYKRIENKIDKALEAEGIVKRNGVYLKVEEAEIVDMLDNLKDNPRNSRMAEESTESPVSDEEQITASEVVEPEIVAPEPIVGQETEEAAETRVEEDVSEVEEDVSEVEEGVSEVEDGGIVPRETERVDLTPTSPEDEVAERSFERMTELAIKIEDTGATEDAAWNTAGMVQDTLQNLLVDTGLVKDMDEAWEYSPDIEGVEEIITPEGKKARGLWDYTQNLIQLASGQLESTAPHETVHWARQLAYDFGVNELEGYTETFKGVEEWAGVKDGNWTREADERLQRGFEVYMQDGVAPTRQVRDFFAFMKRVIVEPLKRLAKLGRTEISDDVRDFFDLMVVGKDGPKVMDGVDTAIAGDVDTGDVDAGVDVEVEAAPKASITKAQQADIDESIAVLVERGATQEEIDAYRKNLEELYGAPIDIPDTIRDAIGENDLTDELNKALSMVDDPNDTEAFENLIKSNPDQFPQASALYDVDDTIDATDTVDYIKKLKGLNNKRKIRSIVTKLESGTLTDIRGDIESFVGVINDSDLDSGAKFKLMSNAVQLIKRTPKARQRGFSNLIQRASKLLDAQIVRKGKDAQKAAYKALQDNQSARRKKYLGRNNTWRLRPELAEAMNVYTAIEKGKSDVTLGMLADRVKGLQEDAAFDRELDVAISDTDLLAISTIDDIKTAHPEALKSLDNVLNAIVHTHELLASDSEDANQSILREIDDSVRAESPATPDRDATVKGTADRAGRMVYDNVHTVAQKAGGGSVGETNKLHDFIHYNIEEGYNNSGNNQIVFDEQKNELKKAHGIDSKQLRQELDKSTTVEIDGKQHTISNDSLVSIYMLSQGPEGRDALMNSPFIEVTTQKKQVRKGRMADKKAVIELPKIGEIEGETDEEIEAATLAALVERIDAVNTLLQAVESNDILMADVNAKRQHINENISPIRQRGHLKTFGYEMPDIENYYRIKRSYENSDIAGEMPTTMGGMLRAIRMSSNKERTGSHKRGLDFTEPSNKTVLRMEREADFLDSHGQAVRKFDAMVKDPGIKRSVSERIGESGFESIKGHLNEIYSQTYTPENEAGKVVNRTINGAMRNFQKSVMAFNARLHLQQRLSLTNAANYLGVDTNLLKSMVGKRKSTEGQIDDIAARQGQLNHRVRYGQGMSETKESMDFRRTRNFYDTPTDFTTRGVAKNDIAAIKGIIDVAIQQEMRAAGVDNFDNLTEAQKNNAAYRAKEAVRITQPSSMRKDKSAYGGMRSTLGKQFNRWQSFNDAQRTTLSREWGQVSNLKRKAEAKGATDADKQAYEQARNHAIAVTINNTVVSGLLLRGYKTSWNAAMIKGAALLFGGDHVDTDEYENPETLKALFGIVPGSDQAIDALLAVLGSGDSANQAQRRLTSSLPVAEVVVDAVRGVKGVVQGKWRGVKDLVNAAGTMTGMPGRGALSSYKPIIEGAVGVHKPENTKRVFSFVNEGVPIDKIESLVERLKKRGASTDKQDELLKRTKNKLNKIKQTYPTIEAAKEGYLAGYEREMERYKNGKRSKPRKVSESRLDKILSTVYNRKEKKDEFYRKVFQ